VVAIALLACAIVYGKFLFYGHISWDDPEMVFKNKDVQNMNLKALFTNHYVGNYVPVTMLVHSIAWLFFENNDTGHHVLNILLHLVNGLLLYKLGRELFKNNTIAGIGVIIFLLHPLQVESVGWISELKNILSTTFYLLSILSYLKYTRAKTSGAYLLSILYFTIGCLSKPSVVVLPLALLGLDFYISEKITLKHILSKIPFLCLSIIFGIINIKAQTADQFINYSHAFPCVQRFGLAGYALIKYLVLFMFPVNLSVIYPYPEIKTAILVLGYIFFAILIGVLAFYFRKNKIVVALVLFILTNLVLVLQFVPFGEVLYADRYMYVPIIGMGWITGYIFSKLKTGFVPIGIGLIVVFGTLTFSRASAWTSALNLYEDIITKYPNQFIALNSAGVETMRMNQDEKSLEYFNRAVKAAPNNYKSYYNRGLLYLKNNKPELAVKSLNQALALYDYSKAYVARASAYYMINDLPKAMNDANYVLQKEPGNSKAHFVLGNCFDNLNRLDEAMKEYNKCIELDGSQPEYYFKRAIVLGKKQDFKSCLGDLTISIELDPFYYEAYYWRGVAKVNLQQNACDDFRTAARNNVKSAVNAFNKYCR
jgi:Flp pilus assembly protein TadD